MNKTEYRKELFSCDCGDLRHVFSVYWDRTTFEKYMDEELYISVLTDHNLPLKHRIKNAFNHVFKRKNYHIAGIILRYGDAEKLYKSLGQYLNDRNHIQQKKYKQASAE